MVVIAFGAVRPNSEVQGLAVQCDARRDGLDRRRLYYLDAVE